MSVPKSRLPEHSVLAWQHDRLECFLQPGNDWRKSALQVHSRAVIRHFIRYKTEGSSIFFLFSSGGKKAKLAKNCFFVVVFVFPCPHTVVSIKEKSFKLLKVLKVDLVVTSKEPKNLLRDFFLDNNYSFKPFCIGCTNTWILYFLTHPLVWQW